METHKKHNGNFLENFREGVSFSYPHVTEGTEASFVTIYSDSAKKIRKNKEGEG